MTQRPDQLRLSITDPAVRDALRGLVVATAATGRNRVPSLSELLRRVGMAYSHAPEEVVKRDPFVRDEAGRIVAVKLVDDNGQPYTLADARAANPGEFWQFAAAMVGGEDEEE